MLPQEATKTQRWRDRRQHWRVDRDEGFRKADFSADIIRDGIARAFVTAHHYSGSYPVAVERVGLFRGIELVGAAVFSIPINNNAVPRYTGLKSKEGVELGRFVLLDEVPYNAESFFLAKAMGLLYAEHPELRGVIAYSDPVPRQAAEGRVVMPGHVGVIYQASSASYAGRAQAKTLHVTADGIALSSRGLSKIRLQEHGAASAEKRLIRLGAPPRAFGQDPAEWVSEVLDAGIFKKVSHPGNHVYCFALGPSARKRRTAGQFAPARPYPKMLDSEKFSKVIQN
ncbi:hypothetical protein [Polaromonas sp.]|uniref:Mom family adenine methylcarbamoylation protein n=1 Tax=Polaromonas sp. TaxID=1869339 RepID=UPI00352A0E25